MAYTKVRYQKAARTRQARRRFETLKNILFVLVGIVAIVGGVIAYGYVGSQELQTRADSLGLEVITNE